MLVQKLHVKCWWNWLQGAGKLIYSDGSTREGEWKSGPNSVIHIAEFWQQLVHCAIWIERLLHPPIWTRNWLTHMALCKHQAQFLVLFHTFSCFITLSKLFLTFRILSQISAQPYQLSGLSWNRSDTRIIYIYESFPMQINSTDSSSFEILSDPMQRLNVGNREDGNRTELANRKFPRLKNPNP